MSALVQVAAITVALVQVAAIISALVQLGCDWCSSTVGCNHAPRTALVQEAAITHRNGMALLLGWWKFV